MKKLLCSAIMLTLSAHGAQEHDMPIDYSWSQLKRMHQKPEKVEQGVDPVTGQKYIIINGRKFDAKTGKLLK